MTKFWFSKNLGDGMMAPELTDEIREQFRMLYTESGNPEEMAVFTRYDSEGRLHCEGTAYFSPAAAGLAKLFDAEPCVKPPKNGLGLMAGSQASWSILFPENPG
jgi:hypothetical protein